MSGPMPKSSTQKQAKSPADSMGGVSPPTCKGARSGPFACQRIPSLLACFYSATLAWNLSAVDRRAIFQEVEHGSPFAGIWNVWVRVLEMYPDRYSRSSADRVVDAYRRHRRL